MTLTGSQSAINATLAGANGVIYQPTSEYEGSDTLTMVSNDQGNSGSGGPLSDTDTVAMTVNGVADTPVVSVPPSGGGGLLGYWAFDGTGVDLSGNGYNLTLNGSAGYGTGLYGQALSLNGVQGTNATANTTNNSTTPFDFGSGSGNFTIQVWANFNGSLGSFLNHEETLIEKFIGGAGPGWTFTLAGGTTLSFYWTGFSINAPVSISNNVWHEFVVEKSGNTFEMFLDGSLVATANDGGATLSASSNPLLIGARNSVDGRNFTVNGLIDNVGIWNRALSTTEITNQ